MKNTIKMMSFFALLTFSLLACKKDDEKPNTNVSQMEFTVNPSNLTFINGEWGVGLLTKKAKESISNGGAVLVYTIDYWGTYRQLPYTITIDTYVNRSFYYLITDERITFYISDEDKVKRDINLSFRVKVVFVSNVAKKSLDYVDVNNYEEVKEALHLRD